MVLAAGGRSRPSQTSEATTVPSAPPRSATTATSLPLARRCTPLASCLARVVEGSCCIPCPARERNFSSAWGGERRKGAPMGPWHRCPSAANQRDRGR